VDEVFPIEAEDAERARGLLLGVNGLSARVAIHGAVMGRRRVNKVLSFDTGFDQLPGLERLA